MTPLRVVLADDDDRLRDVLTALQRALLRHPVAAQDAFATLARLGRRHAATDEGAALLDALERSPAVERLRLVWESVSLGVFTGDDEEPIPDAVVEVLVALLAREGLEALLGGWFAARAEEAG